MGNCSAKTTKSIDKGHPESPLKETTKHTGLHEGMLQELHLDVYQKYEELEVLGKGGMGHVARVRVRDGAENGSAPEDGKKTPNARALAQRRDHRVDYALKMIALDRISTQHIHEMKNEIDILRSMDHPNIIKAHEHYYYKKHIYLILELCDGGDLNVRQPYTEHQAATIMGKLMSAVKYMHDHGIVHRDLKLENVMFENKSENAEIKVIDFGMSKKFLNNQLGVMHKRIGTLYAASPQVFQGTYSSHVDLWASGVIAFIVLSNRRPFYQKTRPELIEAIKSGKFKFEKEYWAHISREAKDFVRKLLVVDPEKRMDAGQALKHAWLSKEFRLSLRAPSKDTVDAVQGNLIRYMDTSSFKKIALNVIAHSSTTDEIMELRKLFDQFDTANNGVISFEEFQAAMKSQSYTEEELQAMFDSIDVNHNGEIMYTEFLAAAIEVQGNIVEERVAEAFSRLDSDGTGFISRQNLRDFLGKDGTMERIDKLIEECDKDHDGQISYEEFVQMFRKQTKKFVRQVSLATETPSDDDSQRVASGKTAISPQVTMAQ